MGCASASADQPLRGTWIWCEPAAADRNVYACFRRGFRLDRPESVRVRITADSFYTLFVDGRFVARGPARGPLSAYSFDTHALELGAGAHALAVLVHHVGEVNATIMTGRPGLLVEAGAGGHDLSSGAAWCCRKSDAWRRDFPEKMSHFGFPEECDLRAIPAGWTGLAFQDGDWSPATVVARVGDAPWTALMERDIPPLRHADVPARGVTAHGRYTPGAAGGMPSKEVAGGRFGRAANAAVLPFRFAADAGAFLTLDFGRTVSGYPRLAFAGATAGTVVELSYDELLTADGAVDPERTYARLTDRFILAGGAGTVATAHPRGFRYLMLTVREPAGLELRAAVVDEETYPFTVRNRFACADPLLETLHATGVETVRVCTQDAFMDCPSRERVQWTADLLMHGRVAATACADTVMLRHTLLQAAQSQLPDGRINGFFPSERTNCAFAASSLSWLHALIDYWEFTGNAADLAALVPALQQPTAAERATEIEPVFLTWEEGWKVLKPGTPLEMRLDFPMGQSDSQGTWPMGRYRMTVRYMAAKGASGSLTCAVLGKKSGATPQSFKGEPRPAIPAFETKAEWPLVATAPGKAGVLRQEMTWGEMPDPTTFSFTTDSAEISITGLQIECLARHDIERLKLWQNGWVAGTALPQSELNIFCGEGLFADYFGLDKVLAALPGAQVKTGLVWTVGQHWGGLVNALGQFQDHNLAVLGDVAIWRFSPSRLDQLRGWVEAGGRLVMTGGPHGFGRGGWHLSDLMQPMYPAELGGAFDLQPVGVNQPAVLTPVSPLAKKIDFSAAPVVMWQHVMKAKPDSTVHVSAGGQPVIITRPYGKGKVCFIALAPLGDAPAGKTAFWAWDRWPELMKTILEDMIR